MICRLFEFLLGIKKLKKEFYKLKSDIDYARNEWVNTIAQINSQNSYRLQLMADIEVLKLKKEKIENDIIISRGSYNGI